MEQGAFKSRAAVAKGEVGDFTKNLERTYSVRVLTFAINFQTNGRHFGFFVLAENQKGRSAWEDVPSLSSPPATTREQIWSCSERVSKRDRNWGPVTLPPAEDC